MSGNRSLHRARQEKNDEFYTQIVDIEAEIRHYDEKIWGGGQTVYCNCDDPTISNFFQFFSTHFERLRLKKLITTCYQSQERDLFPAMTALTDFV